MRALARHLLARNQTVLAAGGCAPVDLAAPVPPERIAALLTDEPCQPEAA